jgi:hypothetical protein
MKARALLALASGAVLLAGGCGGGGGSAAPALTDPTEMLTRAVSVLGDARSVHVHADVSGVVQLDLFRTGKPAPLDLAGTTAEADADIAGGSLHLTFSGLLGLTGDVITIGGARYVRVSLLGPRYTRSESGTAGDPLSALSDPRKLIDGLRAYLARPGMAPVRRPDEPCGDQACYRVSLALTSDELRTVTGALPSVLTGGTGTVDVWIEKNDVRPVRATIAADAGSLGTLTVAILISKYNAPVTIAAPPDADVAPAAT